LDIKQTFERYDALTGIADSGKIAYQALELRAASGIPFECRTTVHPHWHSEQDILELGIMLAGLGVTDYALQGCRPMGDAARHINLATPVSFPSSATLSRLASLFERFIYRQA
jgi:pyruvate formate lyase activating enzyme